MIKFDNVFFKYNNSKNMTLADISFEVLRGSWLTILGENGSGKSTLMKLLYGQNLATKGKILFENKEYTKETYNDIRQKIAVVFQNPDNQFVGATVEEDIAFGLENKNLPREKMEQIICEVLDIVDMKDYRKFEPTSLSGGQKQRVAIASALALQPEVLILDEATSMLDPVARKSILGYIKKIKTEEIGKAAMIIGAGRAKKEDEIDHAVGINIFKKVGEKIAKNEKIAEIYYNNDENVEESKNMILEAFVLTEEKVEKQKAVLKII